MINLLSSGLNSLAKGILRPDLMRPTLFETSVRFRSRRSTRLKREAKKAKIKAKLLTNPKKPTQSFMQKVHAMLMKGRLPPVDPSLTIKPDGTGSVLGKPSITDSGSCCLSWPSRRLYVPQSAAPTDDVFLLNQFHYAPPIEEALAYLRRLYHPTIYDDPNAAVTMRLDLNMNLDLIKQEYVENFKDMFVMPHKFEFGKKRVVMAFSREPEAQMAAREAGADFVGGTEVIRKIRRGELKVGEVDYFICNIDVIQEVAGLRGILNDKLPTQSNGLVGLDIIPLVKHYSQAVTMEVKQDERQPDWGVTSLVIGRLSMPDEHLVANAGFVVQRLSTRRLQALSLGHFVHRALFVCAEHRVHVGWDFRRFAPPLPDNDSALQALADAGQDDKGGKKRRKRKVAALVV